MPFTCRDFVKANMELMSDEALEEIVDYLKKRNANIPEDESDFDKIDSDNWIHMQEDCLHMYHQLLGIERYLLSVSEDVKVKRLLKQVALSKKAIGERRVEFFEKEEGHLYEKIGEGVYRRK